MGCIYDRGIGLSLGPRKFGSGEASHEFREVSSLMVTSVNKRFHADLEIWLRIRFATNIFYVFLTNFGAFYLALLTKKDCLPHSLT